MFPERKTFLSHGTRELRDHLYLEKPVGLHNLVNFYLFLARKKKVKRMASKNLTVFVRTLQRLVWVAKV